MSYQNFIPTVWNEQIDRELERLCVFAEDCNRKYEGKVKDKGESVKILGVGKPTIRSIAKADRNNDIEAAETIEDTSIIMVIDQIRYFNYKVGDIDKAQAVGGVMDALQEETSEGLANEVDTYIANLAKEKQAVKLYPTAKTVVVSKTEATGERNVLRVLDDAAKVLYKNDVKTSTPIIATVDVDFYMAFREAYGDKDTDNSKILKNGKVAMYGNITIKMSNNVAKDGNTSLIQVKTKRAIAYAKPLTHTEPYRPENGFADAVKGFILFGAKIVRPKEMVVANVISA